VHGYQGNSFDFQKAKNYLRKSNRNTHILIIESITSDMNQSIEHLGQQAANELIKYLEYAIFNFTLINFIGFSLGGIIARAAFVYLRKYWDRFNLFITFSSPHLGISECENSLVNLGVWYLIKVDKVKNLKELNFQSVSFNESTLMKLSNCEALAQFKKVVLVCSKNDGFVPYYSTVLDERKCERTEIKDLCRNLTSRMKEIERVELCFEIENSGTLDKLTGRRGHI
jgi:pimeloyl-ACP methyl ester carboxylesterase